jgi:hypothetical protein
MTRRLRKTATALLTLLLLLTLPQLNGPLPLAEATTSYTVTDSAWGIIYGSERSVAIDGVGRIWVAVKDNNATSKIALFYSIDGVSWTYAASTPAIGGLGYDLHIRGNRIAIVTKSTGVQFINGTIDLANASVTFEDQWVTVDSDATGYAPTAAIDSDGRFWAFLADGAYLRVYKSLNGKLWVLSKEIAVTSSTTYYSATIVLPLSSGKLFLVAQPQGEATLYYAEYNGSAWSSVNTYSLTSAYTQYPNAAVSAAVNQTDDTVHLVYLATDGTNRQIMYMRYNGSAWSSPQPLSDLQHVFTYPNIGIDNDYIHVVWRDETDASVWRVNKTSSGWGSAEQFTTTSGTAFTGAKLAGYGRLAEYGVVWIEGSASPYVVKFAKLRPSQSGIAPSISTFGVSSVLRPDLYYLLNATVYDPDGISDLVNATVELSNGVILKWDAATNSFSEHADPNGYLTLDAAGSFKTQISSIALKLTWKVKFNFPSGYVSVVRTNTFVYDTTGMRGQGESGRLAYFVNYSGWWNNSWTARKMLAIYEVRFKDYVDLELPLNITYADNMKPDFSDLRFTWINITSGEEVLLNAWLENKSDSAWAYIFLRIPELASEGVAILFLYYYNVVATPYWDFKSTFRLADDFDDGVIDTTLWVVEKKGSANAVVEEVSGTLHLAGEPSVVSSGNLRSTSTFTNDIIVELRRNATDQYYRDVSLGYGNLVGKDGATNWWHTTFENGYLLYIQSDSSARITKMVSGTYTDLTADSDPLDSGTYHLVKVIYRDTGLIKYYMDGTLIMQATDTTFLNSAKYLLLSQGEYSAGYGGDTYIDWVRVRTYIEDSWFSVSLGSEEALTANQAPTLGGFSATSTIYAGRWGWLNVTANDPDGQSDLDKIFVALQIGSDTVKLGVTGAGGTPSFSEVEDSQNILSLDSSNSARVSINSTAYKFAFRIRIHWNATLDSSVDIVAGTGVQDASSATGNATQTGLFAYENRVQVSSLGVDDSRVNPSQGLTFTATIHYYGTSEPVVNLDDYLTVKLELSGVEKASTTSIAGDGSATLTVSAEATVGNYTYKAYVAPLSHNQLNQTRWVVVDRALVQDVSFSSQGSPSFAVVSEYDGSSLTHSSSQLDNDSWRIYNIQYGLANRTLNLYERSLDGVAVKLYAQNRTLAFNQVGQGLLDFNVTGAGEAEVWVGSLGRPILVDADGSLVAFSWDSSTRTVSFNPGSRNKLYYQFVLATGNLTVSPAVAITSYTVNSTHLTLNGLTFKPAVDTGSTPLVNITSLTSSSAAFTVYADTGAYSNTTLWVGSKGAPDYVKIKGVAISDYYTSEEVFNQATKDAVLWLSSETRLVVKVKHESPAAVEVSWQPTSPGPLVGGGGGGGISFSILLPPQTFTVTAGREELVDLRLEWRDVTSITIVAVKADQPWVRVATPLPYTAYTRPDGANEATLKLAVAVPTGTKGAQTVQLTVVAESGDSRAETQRHITLLVREPVAEGYPDLALYALAGLLAALIIVPAIRRR